MKTILRALAWLPLPLLHALGAAVGWLSFVLSGTYRRRFLGNAAQAGYAFGQVRAAVAESGKLVMETARLWYGAPVAIEWMGNDLVAAAQARGKGIVFLTPHIGCFEAAAMGYARFHGPVTVLYRPARKAWLRDIVATGRVRPNLAVAPTTLAGVKQLVKALRAGEAVGMLPDQVPPQDQGVWAPFFGQPAYTMTLPAKLAQLAGATLLFVWGERLSWGRGYRIHVREWVGPPEKEPVAAATQLNEKLEKVIAECPGQYLWGYERYKQPVAELSL